jgi:hypothetical protein
MYCTTGYEIRKSGYVEENGMEHDDVQVFEAKTKNACIDYAKKKNLDRNDHFIQSIGHETIRGLKVPATGEDMVWLYQIKY